MADGTHVASACAIRDSSTRITGSACQTSRLTCRTSNHPGARASLANGDAETTSIGPFRRRMANRVGATPALCVDALSARGAAGADGRSCASAAFAQIDDRNSAAAARRVDLI